MSLQSLVPDSNLQDARGGQCHDICNNEAAWQTLRAISLPRRSVFIVLNNYILRAFTPMPAAYVILIDMVRYCDIDVYSYIDWKQLSFSAKIPLKLSHGFSGLRLG